MKIKILEYIYEQKKYLCKVRLCDLYNEPEIDSRFETIIHAEILIDNEVILKKGIIDINYIVPIYYAISV